MPWDPFGSWDSCNRIMNDFLAGMVEDDHTVKKLETDSRYDDNAGTPLKPTYLVNGTRVTRSGA